MPRHGLDCCEARADKDRQPRLTVPFRRGHCQGCRGRQDNWHPLRVHGESWLRPPPSCRAFAAPYRGYLRRSRCWVRLAMPGQSVRAQRRACRLEKRSGRAHATLPGGSAAPREFFATAPPPPSGARRQRDRALAKVDRPVAKVRPLVFSSGFAGATQPHVHPAARKFLLKNAIVRDHANFAAASL